MFMGQDGFIWWVGVVEDISDPMLIGRAKVRIFGYHPAYNLTEETYVDTETNKIGTADLPWAVPIMPINMHNAYGTLKLGEWVFGFFLDGKDAQEPAILGYIPSSYNTLPGNFGRYGNSKSFSFINGEGETTASGLEYTKKLSRFEWRSLTNHFIRITDFATQSEPKDFTLSHSTPNLYFSMNTDINGKSFLTIKHPKAEIVFSDDSVSMKGPNSSTSITLNSSDIVVSGPSGSYNLIDQLNWISLQTHTTSDGSELGPRTFNIGRRPPPTPPAPPRRRGCFAHDTLVTMADGSRKKIIDIKIGDEVLAKDRKTSNKVKFIEIVDGSYFDKLYSPKYNLYPFATMDHPLYINNKLYSANPELTESSYPWLGKQLKMTPIVIDNKESKVYNLWLDGDSTYIVNDFATTSIIYDGGMLTKLYEKKLCSREKILSLYEEYTKKDETLLHGAFLLNYFIGKINHNHLYKFISYCAHKEYNHPVRKIFLTTPMIIISKLFSITSRLHKWRFIK